ncbi:MAG: ATP-binding cassette domain-containing protein [Thermomicrobiales bacterium]|nr:ATP-binding cassette domain-containing protein [Thermomicrobiales bacterium]
MAAEHVVVIEDLVKEYPVRGADDTVQLVALDAVNLSVERGEILGIMGESGCGKSTLAKVLLRLEPPTSGRVEVDSEDIARLTKSQAREYPRKVQMVFQDPYAALAPRMRVGAALEEPLAIHQIGDKPQRRQRVEELLALVGLDKSLAGRYPHQLSGGQRQRVNIARALALDPEVLVLDEPVSALDVSVQAQVLNLLREVHQRLGVTYLFISHDLRVVRYLCERVGVMYLGSIVEDGPSEAVFASPMHPYTLALLHSIPDHQAAEGGTVSFRLKGEVPNPIDRPTGCAFHPRCPMAQAICTLQRPPLRPVGGKRFSACHFAEDVPELGRQLAQEATVS